MVQEYILYSTPFVEVAEGYATKFNFKEKGTKLFFRIVYELKNSLLFLVRTLAIKITGSNLMIH